MKLLCIGNSFSEDATAHLSQIAQSAGVHMTVGNLIIGGCNLDTHLNNLNTNAPAYIYDFNQGEGFVRTENKDLAQTLQSEAWDVITLQQASHDSGVAESYAALSPLLTGVQALCPTAKLYWHMTWAYQKDSNHWAFPRYANNQNQMYEGILACVRQQVLPDSRFSGIIPNGTAIQNARSILGDSLTRDGFHLSYAFGRYLAGLTFFSVLTGKPASSASYLPEGVTEEQASLAKKCVEQALLSPFTPCKGI